jgi:hypothetical protein
MATAELPLGDALDMNHKRKRPKSRRAGCLLCKPNKLNANKTAERMKARREWRRIEELS